MVSWDITIDQPVQTIDTNNIEMIDTLKEITINETFKIALPDKFNKDKFTIIEFKSYNDEDYIQPIRIIFNSFEGFKIEIRRIFRNSNELEIIEKKIFNFKFKLKIKLELEKIAINIDLNNLIQNSIESNNRFYRFKQNQRLYKSQENRNQRHYCKNKELDAMYYTNRNNDQEKKYR
ncbi:hypothetical protein EAF04_000797 [Stromatinia cepivora]|nr:hypothetical protein EAF04_000797 [Stromatinia cepivora]